MAHDEDDDDRSGYKRTPKHSRWRKGQSGNPGGRRTKPVTLAQLLQKIANETVTVRGPDGKRITMSQVEALLRRHFGQAIAGNSASTKIMFDLLKQLEWVARRPMTDRELTRYLTGKLTPAGWRAIEDIQRTLQEYLPRDENGDLIPRPPEGAFDEPYFDDDDEDEDDWYKDDDGEPA